MVRVPLVQRRGILLLAGFTLHNSPFTHVFMLRLEASRPSLVGRLVGLLVFKTRFVVNQRALFVCVRGSCPPLAWFYLSNTEAYSCLQVWVQDKKY